MIAHLRGTLIEANLNRVIIECGGVGYEVLVSSGIFAQLPEAGAEMLLHTRHIFREDGQMLVGFLDPSERRLFDLLTEVKGCGPKVSLQVIGDLGAAETISAIASEDAKRLSRANGVGPRLAERIIVELKEKVRQENLLLRATPGASPKAVVVDRDSELVDALLALGYRRAEAENAIAQAQPLDGTVEERLLLVLRVLSR